MLAWGGPSTSTVAAPSARPPLVAAAVATAMGQVVSTMASSTHTRRKNSRQHGG